MARQPWKSFCGQLSTCYCNLSDRTQNIVLLPLGLCVCCPLLPAALFSFPIAGSVPPSPASLCPGVTYPKELYLILCTLSLRELPPALSLVPGPPSSSSTHHSSWFLESQRDGIFIEGRSLVLLSTQCQDCHSGGTQAMEEIKERSVVSAHQPCVYLAELCGTLALQCRLPLDKRQR